MIDSENVSLTNKDCNLGLNSPKKSDNQKVVNSRSNTFPQFRIGSPKLKPDEFRNYR